MKKTAGIFQYPIIPYLEQICSALRNSPSHCLILTAETAAGKSTVLPLALLKNFSGKILMTEPRRLAVLGVANRLGELSDNENETGYKIHLDSRITENTRLEVMTEAILVRQLQSDPALEDYNVVVLDEFHERSVYTDLALAFMKEAMQLRDDLFLVIMSATIDTKKLQEYLRNNSEGGEAEIPVFSVPGRLFPVELQYAPGKSVEWAVRQSLQLSGGNILVFLPGLADIRKTQESLLSSGLFDADSDNELFILHSSISLEEQKRVITPPREGEKEKRRVILSSAIAETSLTVPGVTTVIDSGLARINRMDLNTGMEKLCTETESEFSAEQRKGRAGRLCQGNCIRLWDQHDPRLKELAPEILRTDLVPLVLECSERGVYSVDGIDWLDSPSKAAWKTSSQLLKKLDMIRDDGHLTEKGRAALTLGLHPRLAGIALEAFDIKSGKLREEGHNLLLKFSSYSKASHDLQNRFIFDLERRLKNCNYISGSEPDFLILCGYPDRLAMRTSEQGIEPAEYKFAGGRQARLYSAKAPLWLVAPDVMAKNSDAVIFEFTELPEAKIDEFLEKNCEIREICSFAQGTLQKFEQKCYGEIVLSSKKISAKAEDFAQAWINEIREKGLECLPCDDKVENLLLRAEFIEQQKKDGKGSEIQENPVNQLLLENVEEWLLPFLSGAKTLTAAILYDALYWYLNGSEIDRLAPEQLVLENGCRVKVKYEKQVEIRPVIEVIIQRIFGCFTTPKICGKKVLLRLLSPASRPLQVTEDLEHFWTGAWVEICKEMKGRYPKHNWDLPTI